MLQVLKNETKNAKATDTLVVGDFNEDVNTKNIQVFVVEMGLCKVFSEVHEAEEKNRDETFECGTK